MNDSVLLEFFGNPNCGLPPVDPPNEAQSIAQLYTLMRFGRWSAVLHNTYLLERSLPDSENFHVIYCRLVALFKLRRFQDIDKEIMSILMFQPAMSADSNPLKRGLIFSLKLMQAELPHHHSTGKTKEAIQRIDNLIEQTRRSSPDANEFSLFRSIAAVRQSDLYTQIGNFPAAVVHLNQAIALLPRHAKQKLEPHLWTSIGRIFFSIGDLENCKSAFDKASKSDIDQKHAALMSVNRALILVAEERYQEAMVQFELLVGQDDEVEPICVNNYALCALQIGRAGAAMDFLEDAVRNKPSSNLTPVLVTNLLKLYQVLPGCSNRISTLAKLCQFYAPNSFDEAKLLRETSNSRTTIMH